ncbi:hypothetical protein, partial [Thalassotalea sp. Y01]|uniref:hypothetical protein n=1 Tax=Thalassotalea sp. Y01 TaxID=2729613 RepID=UPI001B7D500E
RCFSDIKKALKDISNETRFKAFYTSPLIKMVRVKFCRDLKVQVYPRCFSGIKKALKDISNETRFKAFDTSPLIKMVRVRFCRDLKVQV